ncbi:MAG: hypothetical protein ABH821_05155 [archaeon]
MEKNKQFLFCPSCGKTNIKWFMGGQTGDRYRCPDCDYIGLALSGTGKFIENYKKKLEKSSENKNH